MNLPWKIFGKNNPKNNIGIWESAALYETLVPTLDINQIQDATYEDAFFDGLPTEEQFTTILYTIDKKLNTIQTGEIQYYNDDIEYKQYAVVVDLLTGTQYQSLVPNNIGNPLTDNTKWADITNILLPSATNTQQGINYLSEPKQRIQISNNALDANNDIDFTVGVFNFTDGSGQAYYAGGTGQLDVNFGTGNGMLRVGLTKAANTWYRLYMMYNPTTGVSKPKAILATNNLATENPIDIADGFTKYEYIGNILTNVSGNIRAFQIFGREVQWQTPVLDYAGSTGTTATFTSLSVPPGILVKSSIRGSGYHGTGTGTRFLNIYSPYQTTTNDANNSISSSGSTSGANAASYFAEIITDTLGRVYRIATATMETTAITTYGFKYSDF